MDPTSPKSVPLAEEYAKDALSRIDSAYGADMSSAEVKADVTSPWVEARRDMEQRAEKIADVKVQGRDVSKGGENVVQELTYDVDDAAASSSEQFLNPKPQDSPHDLPSARSQTRTKKGFWRKRSQKEKPNEEKVMPASPPAAGKNARPPP